MSDTSIGQSPSNDSDPHNAFRDLRWVSISLAAVSGFALLAACGYAISFMGWHFSSQLLWSLALWSVGVAVGFLFGIPRVLQGKSPTGTKSELGPDSKTPNAVSPTAAAGYEQRVNTNLEEISDWLTKIIVGITLFQLNKLPTLISGLAYQVVSDLPCDRQLHRGYGIAVVIAFSVLGFLFGYLVTRLYLQGALKRAESGLTEEKRLDLVRRAESAETTAQLLRQVAPQFGPAAQPAGIVEPAEPVRQTLQRLADEYRSKDAIRDWAARTEAKNKVAAELFQRAVTDHISRDWLASQDDEALILGLASTVQAFPEPGDVPRILRVASKVKRKHVQYRIVLAIGKLLEQGLVAEQDKPALRNALTEYLNNADPPLASMIRSVMNQLS